MWPRINGESREGSMAQETTAIAAAMPEISTWAMMIVGFCCLGFIAYRRMRDGDKEQETPPRDHAVEA
jgi:hypothetical protein